MAIGILTAIGAIVQGIGTILGKAWDVSKQFITWFLNVIPKPMKFFIFLYMILFLVSVIIGQFLGAGFACDSNGNVYKINFINLYSKTQYVNELSKLCAVEPQESDVVISEFPSFLSMVSSFVGWIKQTFLTVPAYWTLYHGYIVGNSSATNNEICNAFRSTVMTNQTTTRDFVLQEFGENLEQKGYKQVIHVGCVKDKEDEWTHTLKFFNIDIFNFEMWLLLGILAVVAPFAFKWYKWVLKK